MVKASWMVVPEDDQLSDRFHTAKALIYSPSASGMAGDDQCSLQTVGLVGFHIARKLENTPQWIWSTFEHVDNAPTKGQTPDDKPYNFYHPGCTGCTDVNTPPTLPWRPDRKNQPPSQVLRDTAIPTATEQLNHEWQQTLRAVNEGSVWQYYQLIGSQWPTLAGTDCQTPNLSSKTTPSLLANTTLETYIQGNSDCVSCHNNALTKTGQWSDYTYQLTRAQ
jgi:hypothetical protein